MRSSFLLALALMLLAACFYGSRKSAPNPAGEIAALRQEVAGLRDEVARLRNANSPKRGAFDSSDGFATDGGLASPAEILAQLKSLRALQETARSEISSNLLEITVDRGSDAWARGDFKKAMKLLKPLAEAGQPIAEHRVGVMARTGRGQGSGRSHQMVFQSGRPRPG